jgi:hypothetical protein
MKRTSLIISVLSLIIISTDAFASKFVVLKAIDKGYLMVQFKDGDVNFLDNGQGSKAYTGDHYYGWDWVESYGIALNLTNAVNTANWTIICAADSNYGATGQHPSNCYRKSKLNGMSEGEWDDSIPPYGDYVYDYTMEHTIYVRLPYPLGQGKTYTIKINDNTNSDVNSQNLTFDIFNSRSEAIHTNLVGYLNDSSIKSADLYIWMGDGGARDYSSFEGKKVYLYNVDTSTSQEVNTVAFWKTSPEGTGSDVHWFNLTMSTVWTADFTGFNTPGTYRLAIEDIGCSEDFEIKADTYFEPFRVSTIGYFYMRIGQNTYYPGMPVPRKPLYIPYSSPASTRVYITTMSPIHPNWPMGGGDPWDKKDEWAAYSTGVQNNNAYGGHSDAADWDRHLGHVINIYDMLLPYILTDGKLNDDNLQIAESGNGIPDILDEARNEVDFWLRLRDGAGYSHGINNPGGSIPNNLYQAGKTPIAAWANAANAAMLANCFMLAGLDSLKSAYEANAVTAYNYANGLADPMLSATQDLGGVIVRGKDLKMMAAAFLYNLTGNTAYENEVNSLSEATSDNSVIMDTDGTKSWDQLWGTAAYLKTKRTVHYPALFSRMKNSIINEAKNMESNLISSRPSRRATDNDLGWWKTAHNVQRCMVAHAVTDNPADKALFENAMVLEADWGLGRNSLNMVYMTTAATNLAGKRSIENCYTTGRNDGSFGVHPGHTPYLNIQDWWDGMVMFKSSWLTEKCFPVFGTDSNGWPKAEAYFNTRYVFSHSEFTPQQTMNGKAALYGYLYGLYNVTALTFDFNGLTIFCDSWLKVPGDAGYDSRANLYDDPAGIIDFYDFAVFANGW